MIGLSDRMNKILSMCDSLDVWADIGCDHGIISAELVLKGRAKSVIAVDISEASIYKARAYALSKGVLEKVDCRAGDGFKAISPFEADGAILAGMGTPLIINIISKSPEVSDNLKSMVISSNNYHDRLRLYLFENGFSIEREEIVKDANRFYPVMKVRREKEYSFSEMDVLGGKNVAVDETYVQYIDWLINKEQSIIKQVIEGKNDPTKHLKLKSIYEEIRNDRCKGI